MKKILYIHQYFKTPKEGGAIRSYYISKGLVENGYDVNVITAHNKKHYVKKTIKGITVHYLPVYYDNKLGVLRRMFSFLQFVQKAWHLAKTLPKADVCYASSTPLTVGLIALRLKRKLGIPYYFEVRDLWPEAPVQMGAIRNPLLKKYLYWLEHKIYQNADKIIALSPGIRDRIESKVKGKSVSVISNMADTSFFKMPRKILPINGSPKLVISYFGAIGKVNDLMSLIDIASYSKKYKLNIKFKIAGEGSELKTLKNAVKTRKLEASVEFLPYLNKKGVRKLLAKSDAAYVSFADKPILTTNSPNKYFDALAAGKLIIVNTKGWLKEISEEHSCGFYANPKDPADFIQKIRPFLESPTKLLAFQKKSRELAELYYSRELQVQKIIKLFDNEYHMNINDDQVYTLTA